MSVEGKIVYYLTEEANNKFDGLEIIGEQYERLL